MFFRAEYPSIVRAASIVTADRASAEDVAQEAFARAFARWTRISEYDEPAAWVRRVALNLAISAARKKPRSELPGAAGMTGDLDLHRAIASLPRAQRIAVVLHYLEDRSVVDVAAVIGCAPSTAKVHLHRARKRLAHLLHDEELDGDP